MQNRGIIHIVKCCGSGFHQVQALIKQLKDEGMVYEFHACTPSRCLDLLEKGGISLETANKHPHFWVEDIIMPCSSLNDARTRDDLVQQLKKLNHETGKNSV